MEVENKIDIVVRNIYQRQLKEYEAARRLKADERKLLREWVADYNSVYSNPFYVYGDDGRLADYISAYRQCVKEYKITLLKELGEYELAIADLTEEERSDLHEWVSNRNSVYDNPYHMVEDDGRTPVDYIEAIRISAEMRGNYHKFMPDTVEEIPF